jgi:hypothetical protein
MPSTPSIFSIGIEARTDIQNIVDEKDPVAVLKEADTVCEDRFDTSVSNRDAFEDGFNLAVSALRQKSGRADVIVCLVHVTVNGKEYVVFYFGSPGMIKERIMKLPGRMKQGELPIAQPAQPAPVQTREVPSAPAPF